MLAPTTKMKEKFAHYMNHLEADAEANRDELLRVTPCYGAGTAEEVCLSYAREIRARLRKAPSFAAAQADISSFVIARRISGLGYAPFVGHIDR